MAPVWRPPAWCKSAALCSAAMASLALLYSNSDLVSKYIASTVDAFSGFKQWLTPPILFLLMNGVVVSLAFTSGFIKLRQHSDYGEEPEDLFKTNKREHRDPVEGEAGERVEQGEDGDQKDEEDDDGFYPEVLSSFFGDGITFARRKPALQRSASAPSAERKSRFSYPSSSTSLSRELSAHPILLSRRSAPISVSSQPLHNALRPAHTIPKSTSELRNPVSALQNTSSNAEDRDVDQRAETFIGDFYKKMKLQQVNPYVERLERSYG